MAEQRWDPEQYANHAGFVAKLGAPLIELVDPQPGERILDLGCGDGALTAKLLDAECEVVGLDSSPEQVAAARVRGIDAHVGNAEALPFLGEFDAVLSNAAIHWIKDQDACLKGVYRILKPGGRFVGEFGGHGCVARIRSAIDDALTRRGVDPAECDPWFFPTKDEYGALLERHGFEVSLLTLFPRPTPLPGDIGDWLAIFAQPFLGAFTQSEQRVIVDDIRDALRPELYDATHGWVADYVRIRFSAVREEPPSGVVWL